MLIRYSIHKFKNEPISEKIGTIIYFSTILIGLFASFCIPFSKHWSEEWRNMIFTLARVCFLGPIAVTITFTLLGILPYNKRDLNDFCDISQSSNVSFNLYVIYQIFMTVLILKGVIHPLLMRSYSWFIPTSLLILNFYFSNKRLSAHNCKKLEQKIDDLTEQLKNKN
jgi:hypothetical protein